MTTKGQESPCLIIYALGSLFQSFVGHVGPAVLAWGSLVAFRRLKQSSQQKVTRKYKMRGTQNTLPCRRAL
jgi:hypothetical protein